MKLIGILLMSGLIAIACTKTEDHSGHDHDMDADHAKEMTDHADHLHDMPNIADNEKLIYYTCPMDEHKHIHSSEPGKCSECGMKLVPGVVTTAEKGEYFGCPMLIHSHVRHDEPGKCEECGMRLMPMRLVKS